ncbi:geopeptide [Geobacter benzoatilyticus]|uniref:Geopeptide n=1 Tax=Geobacter benzoatilyticus TaxID=2815309 RepID=A0ABX7PZZ0_9BACT|nr:geopeptide [Geobacter benzoatilyticus]QSV44465.1 geopeptide [Geobacter benzoatilyticus]
MIVSQITDEVTVLDTGSPTPPEDLMACCKTTIAATRVQPDE